MNLIDNILNRITMYRLVLYYLIALLLIAVVFGAFGILPYNPFSLILSTFIVLIVCALTNALFAKIFEVQTNAESFYITAMILALIITPVKLQPFDYSGLSLLIWASILAMASKYILTVGKKHIFNPSALAVAITALALNQYASWWIGGNLPMMAFVVIGGLLVVRKLRRFDLVLAFFVAALASIVMTNLQYDPATTIQKVLVHTSLFFFAFVMLTEPLTTPPTRRLRILYGAFVGVLFAPALHIGPISSTPELALVAGNVFSYLISPKMRLVLALKKKEEVGVGMYDFSFTLDKKMNFRPGQYMEWTIGPIAQAHDSMFKWLLSGGGLGHDTRGNRRYFTIASSPTEPDLHLGVRFYDNASSFKKKMLSMGSGDKIVASQIAGDFTLPNDANQKLVFIAGGIGITPFRSMIKYLMDRGEKRDIVLLYSNRTTSEIAYQNIFDEAGRNIGLKTVYVMTGEGQTLPAPQQRMGRIDAHTIVAHVPDYKERMFYISGTHAMVATFQKTLQDMRISRSHIKVDFFPGFV